MWLIIILFIILFVISSWLCVPSPDKCLLNSFLFVFLPMQIVSRLILGSLNDKKKGNSIFANRVRTSIRRWFLKCDYNATPHTVQQQINHRKCFRAAEQNPLRTNVSSRALWFKPCLFFKVLYKYIWLWPQSVIIILAIWNQDWSWWCTMFC